MQIKSFLVRGDGSAIASRINSVASLALNALVLMSLGGNHKVLINTVRKAGIKCPIYLTETYGIIGYDDEVGRSIELMEKGRGSEYGFCGGSGGQGCVVLAYSNDAVAGHTASFPDDCSSMMVIADTSGKWAKVSASAPLHYGGITKQSWVIPGGSNDPTPIPYFWVSTKAKVSKPVGVSAFTGDAAAATESLLAKIPSSLRATGDVGLFPCFTRGVNQYGAENVESDAVSVTLSQSSPIRVYGMFAHGELGPSSFSGFSDSVTNIPCEKHSRTSILAIHTKANGPE